MPKFRLTETLEARVINTSNLSKARLEAYDMVVRMVHDNVQLGRDIRKVHKWNGERVILRFGNNQVVMETV